MDTVGHKQASRPVWAPLMKKDIICMAQPMKSLYNETSDFPSGLILFSFQCNITSTNAMTLLLEKKERVCKIWTEFLVKRKHLPFGY